MEPQQILKLILIFLFADFLLERLLNALNNTSKSAKLPAEAKGIYNAEQYAKMLNYEKHNDKLSSFSSILSFTLIFLLLSSGFFGWLDGMVRFAFGSHPIITGLLFFGILGLGSLIIGLPFEIYGTFVIEKKYGFNTTKVSTFIADKIKSLIISAIIGAILYSVVVYIYLQTEQQFWLYAWIIIASFSVLMGMFYADVILPLFNKLAPLPEGGLRGKILKFSQNVQFPLTEILIMDGSKRSTKANAFFTGLGKKKKIVLFDTLVDKLTEDEVVAVLAHEVGHYKKKHILQSTIISVISTGVYLYIFSLFLSNPSFTDALGAAKPSFHLSILVFGFLFSPISTLLGIGMNILSRKNEFEADEFAKNHSNGQHLNSALKKLAVDSLSPLTPHKAYVFVYYSHPPLLQRLQRLV